MSKNDRTFSSLDGRKPDRLRKDGTVKKEKEVFEELHEPLIEWMTEGTPQAQAPRSDCG